MSPMPPASRPLYLQLRDAVAAAILRGTYREGAQLPSVRALAAQHGANPLTAARAYQLFQRDGLVEVQRGIGLFVARGAAERLRRMERAAFLETEWPALRERLTLLGIPVTALGEES